MVVATPRVLPQSVSTLALCAAVAAGLTFVPLLHNYGFSNLMLGVSLAIFASALLSSVAGFAFSAICAAMLLHTTHDVVHVVQILLVCSLGIQATSVVSIYRSIDWRTLSTFMIGGAIGLPAGLYMLFNAQPAFYIRAIGVLLVAYSAWMFFRGRVKVNVGPRTAAAIDVAAGALGGITGGFAAFPGAFVTIWCGLRGWDRVRQRAVFQPYILFMQLLTLIVLTLIGHHTSSTSGHAMDGAAFAYLPAALAGTFCGLRLFKALNDAQFHKIVLGLLVASGVGLLV